MSNLLFPVLKIKRLANSCIAETHYIRLHSYNTADINILTAIFVKVNQFVAPFYSHQHASKNKWGDKLQTRNLLRVTKP